MDNKNREYLPIKIVIPRSDDNKKRPGGRGKPKIFGNVDYEYRMNMYNQIDKIVDQDKYEYPNVIAKVTMKKGAEAKSHKPNNLIKKLGLSVIGSKKLDEIIVGYNISEMEKNKERILRDNSQAFIANLSAIESIKIYSEKDKYFEFDKSHLKSSLEKKELDEIKITLFNYGKDHVNQFITYLNSININEGVRVVNYSETLNAIVISNENNKLFNKFNVITEHYLVKSVSTLPKYKAITSSASTGIVDVTSFKEIKPLTSVEYPIIGVIDSGISDKNKFLKDWIYDREVFVPKNLQDNSHGTAVASVIQYGNELNGIKSTGHQRFKFLDVIAIGSTISEDDLMDIIYKVVDKHCYNVKIWNLSINSVVNVCNDYSLSDFAMFIDDVQTKFDVQFVISAGNYNSKRYWPPIVDHKELDRVTSPADSILGLTVGSVSQNESNTSIVKINEPSPFSRRGPGAIFVQKPELVDYGGNYNSVGIHKDLGVRVFDEFGSVKEMIGTSFSAPRVTRKLAEVYYSIAKSSMVMAKTLLLHSTKMSQVSYNGDLELFKYVGFGMAYEDTTQILSCTPHKMTMAFEYTLENGRVLELLDFPFPESLIQNGKCYADINMTLGYIPPLDAQFGQEYCRTNIGVTLGTYIQEIDDETGEIKQVKDSYKGRVPLEKKWDEKFESAQVKSGFKWSPIKTYFGRLKGIRSNPWKLKVEVLSRQKDEDINQKFYLVVTIEDRSKEHDIYTEIINQLRAYGYVTNDLLIENIVKIRN